MTRLLWHSNAPHSPTGYGNQTALFLPRLQDRYEVACSSFYGVEGNVTHWQKIPVFPGVGQHYDATILGHSKMFFEELRGGLVVTLMDVWVLEPEIWSQLNVASWAPVDHDPAPPPVVDYFRESGAVPIAMSRFGEDRLREEGLDPLYVPHAIDTSIFKASPQAEAREAVGLPQDTFIVGMFAANKGNDPSRKGFPEAFRAFKALHDRHPDARLYCHTELRGKMGGIDLLALIDSLGIDTDSVFFCDQYRVVHFPYETESMALRYSSIDALLMPSYGEGFGIPSIEAQACGVPVIASDFAAQPETVGAGWLVDGHRFYTPLKSWQFHPEVEAIVEALESAYLMTLPERKLYAEKARNHALGYDIERVVEEYMLPALEEAEDRFEAREPVAVT